MRCNLFWLSDEQWRQIEPYLPTDVRGKERVDDRRVISGILHVIKSGCRWSDCPPEYGPPTTIYNRFVRWAERGVWERLFRELAARAEGERGQAFRTCLFARTETPPHCSPVQAAWEAWSGHHATVRSWLPAGWSGTANGRAGLREPTSENELRVNS